MGGNITKEITEFMSKLISETAKNSRIHHATSEKALITKNLFRSPCQVYVLRIIVPELDERDEREDGEDISDTNELQFFHITHNNRFPDMTITAPEPIKLPIDEPFKPLGQILTKEGMFQYVDESTSIKKLTEEWISIIRSEFKRYFMYEKFKMNWGPIGANKIMHFMTSYRKIQDQDIRFIMQKFVNSVSMFDIIYDKRVQYESENQNRKVIESYVEWKFDPPIWIGNLPKPDMSEKIEGKKLRDYIKCEISTTYFNQKLELYTDGTCRLTLPDSKSSLEKKTTEKNKKEHNKPLNLLQKINFLTTVLHFHNRLFTRQLTWNDLKFWERLESSQNGSNVPPNFKKYRNYEYRTKKKLEMRSDPLRKYIDNIDFKEYIQVSRKKLRKLIKIAVLLPSKPSHVGLILSSIQQASENFESMNDDQAFLQYWIPIEILICKVWKKYVETHENVLEEEDKEQKGRTSKKIKDLKKWKKLSEEEAAFIQKWNTHRNSYVHELQPINEELLKDIAEYAFNSGINIITLLQKEVS